MTLTANSMIDYNIALAVDLYSYGGNRFQLVKDGNYYIVIDAMLQKEILKDLHWSKAYVATQHLNKGIVVWNGRKLVDADGNTTLDWNDARPAKVDA